MVYNVQWNSYFVSLPSHKTIIAFYENNNKDTRNLQRKAQVINMQKKLNEFK